MKVSYNWLTDYLDITIDPHQLSERLSLAGLEVEEVIEKRLDFPNVVVGRVISTEKHPNADKLSLCQVDIGEAQLSIVCGAPNVASGQTVPVAKIGALLPIGLKIKKSKIRGEVSEGMICSEAELGFSERSDGIWLLPERLPLGVPLDKALEFQTDYIFDIAVTPNRPDCMSHIGIAREIGAILGQPVRRPLFKLEETETAAASQVKIRIDTPGGCPRYSARVIRNIKVGPSPTWLVRRLEAVGMRSINNAVDITNYVLLETGHPLHAFDFDLISGSEIIVRESGEGEEFITLDDKPRKLKAGTVLICDGKRPVAIGGIMGGINSEVSQSTKNILLESAYFNPLSIQKSSRYLGLTTEASQRFARGADPNGTIYALDRAAQLLAELCGGEISQGIVDQYPHPILPAKIQLDHKKINTLLGTKLSREKMINILESIELKVEGDMVIIPTFRPDLERTADLAEEIARLYGLDNIPARETMVVNYDYSRNELDFFIDHLKDTLTGMGLQEIITGSMINKRVWEDLTGQTIFPILNPISKDMDGMRNSLLPSMAQVIQYNRNRQIKDLRLFEINRVYLTRKNMHEQPLEEIRLAIALSGSRDGELWYSSHQNNDFYDIKGFAEALLHKISLDNCQFIYYSDFAIENDGLAIQIEGEPLGFYGQLNSKIASFFEIEEPVFLAEFSVQKLFKYRRQVSPYKPIPKFPWVERDLALVVEDELEVGKLVEAVRNNGGNLLKSVDIFDIYRGKQIEAGKKSVALRLVFRSPDRTLTEDEINDIMNKILSVVSKSFDAKLRD
ncbi:MAG: phenylalanine--tRNA ligase subunit beta [Calditrichia bacterium]